MTVRYVADADVSPEMDQRLITLLSTCFRKPEDWVFHERRYFHEPPAHRWYIDGQNGSGELAGHLALHDRTLSAGDRDVRCGGVSEVAVHPRARGRGYARLLASAMHEWLAQNGFEFAVLFGDPAVYASSGYRSAENLIRYTDAATGVQHEQRFGRDPGSEAFMYRPAAGSEWPAPEIPIDLNGKKF